MSSFKLCGKEYQFKMSIGAMRQFKKKTDLDLWYTVVQILETYTMNMGESLITILERINSKVDYFTASEFLHTLAQQEEKTISLDEIQDGMFRVGIRPIEDENGDYIQPWPLVLVAVAQEIDKTLGEVIDVKKKQQTGQS